MKKILILQPSMVMGGVEKSLISLLKVLSEHHQVSLFLMDSSGELMSEIPHQISLFENNIEITKTSNENIFKKFFKKTLKGILTFFGLYKSIKNSILSRIVINGEYDLAISFHGLYENLNQILFNNVNARKKYIFLHGDIEFATINEKQESYMMQADKIITVSKSCAKKTQKRFPDSQVKHLYNLQDSKLIKLKSLEEKIEFEKNTINIVSVSRLSEEKGLLRFLNVLGRLKSEGAIFTYDIIGDGKIKKQIINRIKHLNLQSEVRLLGNQLNPYQFFNNKDLFVLPSYHESFGMVLVESMILNVPVLTTLTISAKEVVGDWGFVCDNSEESLYNKLKYLINNKQEVEVKRLNLNLYNYDNDSMIEKFKRITI